MIVVVSLVAFLGFVRIATLQLRRDGAVFGIIATMAVWLVIGFRDFGFGTDTAQYIRYYSSLQTVSLADAASRVMIAPEKDPVFYLLAKIFSMLGASPRVWIAFLAAIFSISLGRAIYRYSPEPFLSFVASISLGLVYFAMSGLRQTLAMSVLLWSIDDLTDRRPYRFILTVLLASTFHSAALIFLLAYPVSKWRLGWRQVSVVILGFVGAYAAESQIREVIATLAWSETLAQYSQRSIALSLSGAVISISILVFCVALGPRTLEQDRRSLVFYNLLSVGIVFQFMAVVVAEMFRIAMLFNLAAPLLISAAVFYGPNRSHRHLVYGVVLTLLLAYIAWTSAFSGLTLAV